MLWTIFKVSTEFATILPLVFFFFFWLPDMWSPSSLTRAWTCIALHWKLKLQPWTTRQVPWAFQKTTDRVSRTWRVVRCSRWPLSPTISWGFPLQWDLGLIFRLYPPPPSTRFLPEFILSLFFFFSVQFSALHFIFKIIQQRGKLLGLWGLFLDVQAAFRQGDHSLMFSNRRVYWEGIKIFLLPAGCENKVSRIKLAASGMCRMHHTPRSYEALVHSKSTLSYW